MPNFTDSSEYDYGQGPQDEASYENGIIPPASESCRLVEELESMSGEKLNLYERGNRRFAQILHPEESELTLLVPKFFDNLDVMERRALEIAWLEDERPAITAYSSILEGINTYIAFKYPGYWITTPMKVYSDVKHGETPLHTYHYIPVTHFLRDIKEWSTYLGEKRKGIPWTGGYSGVIHISPEPGYTLPEGLYPQDPYEDFSHRMVFPMADLEVACIGTPQEDLSEVASLLKETGFSGWLIRSGNPERGSYHYLSDSIMPYTPHYWRTLGRLTEILTPKTEELSYIHEFAQSLLEADSKKKAAAIGRRILETVPSDKNTGSKIDIRWIGHQLEAGVSILRSEKAKGYVSSPVVVAEIK